MPDDAPNEPLKRRREMFPHLGVADIERMRRFGEVERFAANERLVTSGRRPACSSSCAERSPSASATGSATRRRSFV